jgi:hypothetical protein
MQPHVPDAASIPELIRGILQDLRALVREEIALARVELREQAGRVKAAAFSFGVAAASLAGAGLFLLLAMAFGIADLFAWPLWGGFLAVAVLLGITGGVAAVSGRAQARRLTPVPEETMTTLKENSEWIAKRLSSAPR